MLRITWNYLLMQTLQLFKHLNKQLPTVASQRHTVSHLPIHFHHVPPFQAELVWLLGLVVKHSLDLRTICERERRNEMTLVIPPNKQWLCVQSSFPLV